MLMSSSVSMIYTRCTYTTLIRSISIGEVIEPARLVCIPLAKFRARRQLRPPLPDAGIVLPQAARPQPVSKNSPVPGFELVVDPTDPHQRSLLRPAAALAEFRHAQVRGREPEHPPGHRPA